LGATFAVIQQQKRIWPPCNAVILAMTTHPRFKFATIFDRKPKRIILVDESRTYFASSSNPNLQRN